MWGAVWWRCLESRILGVMGISHSNSSREVVGKDVGGGPVDVGIELACVCTDTLSVCVCNMMLPHMPPTHIVTHMIRGL